MIHEECSTNYFPLCIFFGMKFCLELMFSPRIKGKVGGGLRAEWCPDLSPMH